MIQRLKTIKMIQNAFILFIKKVREIKQVLMKLVEKIID